MRSMIIDVPEYENQQVESILKRLAAKEHTAYLKKHGLLGLCFIISCLSLFVLELILLKPLGPALCDQELSAQIMRKH